MVPGPDVATRQSVYWSRSTAQDLEEETSNMQGNWRGRKAHWLIQGCDSIPRLQCELDLQALFTLCLQHGPALFPLNLTLTVVTGQN